MRMGVRCTAALLALACAGCQGDEDEAGPAPDAAPTTARAPEGDPVEMLEAPIRPELTEAERRAIAQAHSESDEQEAPDEADGERGAPAGLTAEEREAADDDPAARPGGLGEVREARTDEREPGGHEPGAEPPPTEQHVRPGRPAGAVHTGDAVDRAEGEDDHAEDGAGEPTSAGDGGEEVRPGAQIWSGTERLGLVDLAVATGVRERTPEGVSPTYEEMPDLFYCYTAFDNPDEPVTVTHVWRRGDRVVSRVELEVGVSARWRTWSRQRVKPSWTGTWSCEVLAPGGERLGLARVSAGE
ncbi:MAG: DUF2914 domain-containing protein [Myxococcota bacterium]